MQKFYYAQTGHRIGLDRFRRALAVLNTLKDDDITLLCSDFRIAHEARSMGVKNSVGIDVVRNIVNIANRGDKLIFDSDEANPIMLEDMRSYFSTFIRISDNPSDKRADNEFLISAYYKDELTCNCTIVDDKYFKQFDKTIDIGFFFGDDDYEKDLMKHINFIEDIDAVLLLGYYYFLDYEDELKQRFKKTYEFDDYDDFITSCNILITASAQAVLQCLASGGTPIYFQREDYSTKYFELFKSLNIPTINNYNKDKLNKILKNPKNYNPRKIYQNCEMLSAYMRNISRFYQD